MVPSLRVFVYGTLKPGECGFDRFCRDLQVQVTPALIMGELYDLPAGYPALMLGSGWVQGCLLEFEEADVLTILDGYEDYDPQRPDSENLYQRQWREVFHPQTQVSLDYAWVYVMQRERLQSLGGKPIPSGCWPPTAA